MSLFEPKATIELIRSGEEVQPLLDEKGKRLLIDRYFEVSGRKVDLKEEKYLILLFPHFSSNN